MNTIPALQERSHRQSAEKGFHSREAEAVGFLIDAGRTDLAEFVTSMCAGNRIALMHSELSEALEEMRNGRALNETWYSKSKVQPYSDKEPLNPDGTPRKPEGVPSEMADVVVRVMDFCGAAGIDLQAILAQKLDYNASRGKMHGGKKF